MFLALLVGLCFACGSNVNSEGSEILSASIGVEISKVSLECVLEMREKDREIGAKIYSSLDGTKNRTVQECVEIVWRERALRFVDDPLEVTKQCDQLVEDFGQ